MIVVAGVPGGSATGAGRPGVLIVTGERRGGKSHELRKTQAHKNKSKHLKHLLYHGNPKYQFQGKSND
jgi:hypothetical protein